jgi:hypothetical protein
MALIPDTRRAVKGAGDGYEPDTEQEMASNTEIEDEEDQTPKKKKKGKKPKVRDLIEAQRDDLAISKAPEDMEVSVYHLNPTRSKSTSASCCLTRFVKLSPFPRAYACCLNVSP